MLYVRLYAGPDGESHFEDVQVDFAPVEFIAGRPHMDLSGRVPATACAFMHLPVGWQSQGPYNAPRRNYFVTLEGQIELQASDGEVRRFAPGMVLLAEDTSGKGHVTRNPGPRDWLAMVVSPAA